LNQVVCARRFFFCALRFFYGVTFGQATIPERIAYARAPRKLPTVLGGDEVATFLESVSSLKARVALTTAYAAGLRVSEVAALKVSDIDSSRMVMRIEHGKAGRGALRDALGPSAGRPAQLLAAGSSVAVSVSWPDPGQTDRADRHLWACQRGDLVRPTAAPANPRKTPGGIIPLWRRNHLGIGGRHHPVTGGAASSGIWRVM